jgi:hypothetical protein
MRWRCSTGGPFGAHLGDGECRVARWSWALSEAWEEVSWSSFRGGWLNGFYLIAKSPAYHAAFHDVTKGNNTIWLSRFVNGITLSEEFKGYEAGPGWDPVTGWGTPVASVLVPLLAHDDAN